MNIPDLKERALRDHRVERAYNELEGVYPIYPEWWFVWPSKTKPPKSKRIRIK